MSVSLVGNRYSSNSISVLTLDSNDNVVSISLTEKLTGLETSIATKASLTTVNDLASNLSLNYYDKTAIDVQIALGNTNQANNYYTKTQSDSNLNTGLATKASAVDFSNLNGSVTSLITGLNSNSIIATNQLTNYYTKNTTDSKLLLKMDLTGGDFSNNVGFLGESYIQLGKNATRQQDAGRIAYAKYSTGLDIVGAGTVIGSRMTKIYDNLLVPYSVSVGNTSPVVIDESGVSIPQGKALSFSNGSQLINIGYGSITGSELYRLKGVTLPIQDQLNGKMDMLGDIFEVSSVSNFRGQTNTIGLLNVVGDLNLQSNLRVYINSVITPLNLSYLQNLGQNVESSLNAKANSLTVTSQLALKADLSYVNTQLGTCLKLNAGGYDVTEPAEFYKLVFFDDTVIISGVTNLNGGVNVNSNIAAAGVFVSPTSFSYLGGSTSNIQTQINSKANIASPTFTGTVGGITKSMVGLSNVDNTADTAKPISTAQQTALNLKADLTYVNSQIGGISGGINMITLNSKFPASFAPDDSFSLAWAGTGVIPWVKKDGVMEIGKYLDFHSGSGVAGEDYAVRLKAFTYLDNSYGKLEVEGALTVDSDFQFLGNLKVGTVNDENIILVTPTQVSYLAGCTSNVQTQLNSKAAISYVDSQVASKVSTSYVDTAVSTCLRASGGGYTITLPSSFSANTFFTGPVFTDGVLNIRNGINLSSAVSVGVTSVTSTQLSYLSGTTSNLQTQIDSKIGTSYVDTQLASKASTSYVDTAVSTCLKASGGGYTVALPSEFSANTFFTGPVFTDGVLNIRNGINLSSAVSVGVTSVTSTQLSYLSGTTSNLQTQIDSKIGTSYVDTAIASKASTSYVDTAVSTCLQASGGGYTITLPSSFSANTFFTGPVFTDGVLNIRNGANLSSNVSVGGTSVTFTQVSYLSGATSNIQTQLDNKVGTLALPYVLACLQAGDNISIVSGGSGTKLTLTTIADSVGATLYNTTNGRFTAPTAGVYMFTAQFAATTTVNGLYTISIRKNGATIAKSSSAFSAVLSHVFTMAVGEWIEIYLYQTTGSALTLSVGVGNTQAAMRFLG